MSEITINDRIDSLPEKYQRRAKQIRARVGDIKQLLRPCAAYSIREAGKRLHGQLRPQPEIDIEEYAREFKAACADLPDWALSEATNDFLAGRVENHTGQFMPTCAEFARHARSIVRPFLSEMNGLRNEAEKLFQRAEDDRRRELIAIAQADPAVQARVRSMCNAAQIGSERPAGRLPRSRMTDEQREQLGALKKPREEKPSRLLDTPILKTRTARRPA